MKREWQEKKGTLEFHISIFLVGKKCVYRKLDKRDIRLSRKSEHNKSHETHTTFILKSVLLLCWWWKLNEISQLTLSKISNLKLSWIYYVAVTLFKQLLKICWKRLPRELSKKAEANVGIWKIQFWTSSLNANEMLPKFAKS